MELVPTSKKRQLVNKCFADSECLQSFHNKKHGLEENNFLAEIPKKIVSVLSEPTFIRPICIQSLGGLRVVTKRYVMNAKQSGENARLSFEPWLNH